MCPTIFPPNSGSNFATRESNSSRLFHSFRQELLSYTSRLFRNSFGGKCNIRPPGNLCRSIVVVYLLFQIDILLQVGGKRGRLATIVAGPQKRLEGNEPFSNTKQISTMPTNYIELSKFPPTPILCNLCGYMSHNLSQRSYTQFGNESTNILPIQPFLSNPTIVDFSCFSKLVVVPYFFSPKNHIQSGRNIYTTKPKSTNRIANTNKDNSLFGAEYNTTNYIEPTNETRRTIVRKIYTTNSTRKAERYDTHKQPFEASPTKIGVYERPTSACILYIEPETF